LISRNYPKLLANPGRPNGANERRRFPVTAQQASLFEIDAFLPYVPSKRTVIGESGKVARLDIKQT
jgi:hypothetical protein